MPTQRFDFQNSRGETLSGRLERPAGPAKAVALFAHCFTCSKNIAAATRVSRALADRGFAVLRFDFTGLGNSEGDFANTSFTTNVQDLLAAARELERQLGQAPSLLVGHSLGGAAVLAAGTELDSVRAVATIGAPSEPGHVTHLLEPARATLESAGVAEVQLGGRPVRVGRGFLDDVEQFSLSGRIRELNAALLVMHSPIDDVVGIDHARALYQAAQHPKSFVTLDDADHLLSEARDAEYAAEVLAAWATRYMDLPAEGRIAPDPDLAPGAVAVERIAGLRHALRWQRHAGVADEPARMGGSDAGPAPYELLSASLGACTAMTLELYAGRKEWPLREVRVQVDHEAERGTDGLRSDRFVRTIHIGGDLDEAQRARLMEIADKCPVHRTISEGRATIETRLG
jgi:putative redox protein